MIYTKCRNKFNIRINSFYSKFSKIRLLTVSEVIKSMLCKDFNINEAYKYITEDLHLTISKNDIIEIYTEIRYIIYKYFYILYQAENLSIKYIHHNI